MGDSGLNRPHPSDPPFWELLLEAGASLGFSEAEVEEMLVVDLVQLVALDAELGHP